MTLQPNPEIAEDVLRVRLSQMIVNERNKDGDFQVPIHLALGHEAIAVAVARIMAVEDRLLPTHRNIHYNLAYSPRLRPMIDSFMLTQSVNTGRQLGCMNFYNDQAGIIYTSSILGNSLTVAPGVALASRVKKSSSLTIVTTGDGAIEEGALHEAIIMMKSLRLPVLVLVENNEWSLATRIHERRCPIDIETWAAAFDTKYIRLEGNDTHQYIRALSSMRTEALAKETPIIVEVIVKTLGDRRMANQEITDDKFINYHAGVAPTVDLAAGPVIRESPDDPVFALTAHFSRDNLDAMGDRILNELRKELR